MIVDEKQQYIKVAKILRITFVVLFALFFVWSLFVAIIEFYFDGDGAYSLAWLFLAVSLLPTLFQIIDNYRHKNGIVAGAFGILSLIVALVFLLISEPNPFVAVLIVLCIAAVGIFTLRGQMLTEDHPLAAIVLRCAMLLFNCGAILMFAGLISDYFFFCLFLIITPILTVFVVSVGIVIFIVDGVWWCDSCNRKNKGKAKFCCGCGKQRPAPQLPVKPKREKRVRPVAVVAATATQQTAPDQTAQQADWFCPECGTSNLPYAKFCESCGTKNPFDHS